MRRPEEIRLNRAKSCTALKPILPNDSISELERSSRSSALRPARKARLDEPRGRHCLPIANNC
ncbi:hypothetical protein M514_03534 [Trichuris suis]|uniref:Uncharacterized protein n=1 Tax=Trichuris suis TaxID=68888 RepID=A0A085ME36_9BILA|nr:hypothetical protein M513_03534 [Trichuris suis]KFD71286.1 hypothetical protein M514_03534 [Trichuris suis]